MNTKKNIFKILAIAATVVTAVLAPTAAVAKIAGYNVILVQGFSIGDLIKPPTYAEVVARRPMPTYWQERAEGYLNWSSAERIEGGIARMVFEQAKGYAQQGLCAKGCVLVTHSTGDMVVRHFLQNQANWMRNAGLEPLNIIAVVDFAGAGGGTDMADLAVAIINSEYVPQPIKWAVGMVLGSDLDATDYADFGVGIDLQTSVARTHAMSPNAVPRLRISASGSNSSPTLGWTMPVVKAIVRGADDGLIPAHSACGASAPDAILSCSKNIDFNGKRQSVYGPTRLLYNHFPLLMGADYDHGGTIADKNMGKATYVLNNFIGGLNVDFQTYTHKITRNWWEFWKPAGTWQYVKESETKSMASIVYETLDR